jgi:NAD(P)-dependent dehydrogenase (short-subunit alcohol dehydrogenase family)
VTRIDDLKAAIAEATGKLGPVSTLINNAANDQRQRFADVTPDELDRTMAVNFRHIYFACQAVVPQMIERGGGSIVNMSSMAWIAGAPNLAAMPRQGRDRGLTHSLAREMARTHPGQRNRGVVLTEAAAAMVSDREKVRRDGADAVPPEIILPADITSLALFLPTTAAVTGGPRGERRSRCFPYSSARSEGERIALLADHLGAFLGLLSAITREGATTDALMRVIMMRWAWSSVGGTPPSAPGRRTRGV